MRIGESTDSPTTAADVHTSTKVNARGQQQNEQHFSALKLKKAIEQLVVLEEGDKNLKHRFVAKLALEPQ